MRTSRVLLTALVTAGAAASQAAPASAYVHEWSPFTSPSACSNIATNTRCYDNQGLIYNPWGSLRATALVSAVNEICGKAITSSNNLRSTTGGSNNSDYCAANSTEKLVDILGTTPDSRAYVYWNSGSGGGTTSLRGRANTDG